MRRILNQAPVHRWCGATKAQVAGATEDLENIEAELASLTDEEGSK